MKLYLASFLQPENFGPGRIIGITSGTRPKHIDVKIIFLQITPPVELIETYNKKKLFNQEEAIEYFETTYEEQLENFVARVQEESRNRNITPIQVLPFEEGDTLASWERFGPKYSNYRKVLAPYLEKLGYEINLR